MADRKISDLTALTTPATGDLIPIVDISEAAAADKNKSITVGELLRGAPDGTEAAPGFAFESAGGNGMFQPTTGVVSFSTGGSQRVRIDASGRVMINTTTEGHANADNLTVVDSGSCGITIRSANDNFGRIYFSDGTSGDDEYRGIVQYDHTNNRLQFASNALTAMTIDSSQRVGIGVTSPSAPLEISNSVPIIRLTDSDGTNTYGQISASTAALSFAHRNGASNGQIIFQGLGGGVSDEYARFDTLGRLLVGTTASASSNAAAAVEVIGNTTTGGMLTVGRNDTEIAIDNSIGFITFVGNDSDGGYDQCAAISCFADGNHSNTSKASRLVFSTTQSSNISPTERMRIDNGGVLYLGQATTSIPGSGNTTAGHTMRPGGDAFHSASGAPSLYVNRSSTTGGIVSLRYNGTQRGSITTDGTVVAFNTTSDYRLKENVAAVTDGITRLQQLKPSRFNFIENPTKTVDGFIAHEVQDIVPEAVTGEKDAVDEEGNPEYQGIDQSKLVPLLTAALQEAIAKIETLETKVAALEAN